MKHLFYLLPLFLIGTVAAQAQKNDKKNIESLCGCFDVEFKYAETFSPNKDYKYHDRKRLGGTELVVPVEMSDRKYVLQHLLVINDSTVIKHWREDWTFEQPVLYRFEGNKHWVKQTLDAKDVKNKWTQTVWEVDDAPRYQGVGSWITSDGKPYWESTTNAPLPRREYTVRNDYNILKRHNRIVVDNDKWIHEQDNEKIKRSGGEDILLVEEKGINAYTRTDESKCANAREWWKKNGEFWEKIRQEWESQLKSLSSVTLKSKVGDKRLFQYFDEIYRQWANKSITDEEVTAKAKTVIARFIDPAPKTTAYK